MADTRVQFLAKLLNLQGGICFIGEEPISLERDQLEIDHIIPRAKGGKDEENNYAVTCQYHNRNKSDADLRVARCMARYERIKERFAQEGPTRPNLGDFLSDIGGAKYEVTVHLGTDSLEYTLTEASIPKRSVPVLTDKLSGMRSVFLELPAEYLFHDERINPRAVGARLRGLIEEFLDGKPQLHTALTWGVVKDGRLRRRNEISA